MCEENQCGENRPRMEGAAHTDPMGTWMDAFHDAYYDVQVEVLKSKIKARWGKAMEKGADLVLDHASDKIRNFAKRAESEEKLKSKIRRIIEEAP